MLLLFVNPRFFVPQVVGGLETSTLELACELESAGHAAAVMCRLAAGDTVWLRNRLRSRLTGRLFPVDRHHGIPVFRGWNISRGLPEVVERFAPDAVVVQGGTTEALDTVRDCAQLGLETFFYVHDVVRIVEPAAMTGTSEVHWLANSEFTRRTLRERLGVESDVVPPCIRTQAYRAPRGDSVVMVNPRPEKGGAIALEIARNCPDIPFVFVEGWQGSDAAVRHLQAAAALLANVTWMPAGRDMRAIYRKAKLLLVPSLVPETWGRVVTEAQASGIPAVVSDAGALRETVGPGGIVVPQRASAEAWTDAVRSVYQDTGLYEKYSLAARGFADRPEIAADRVAARFVDVLTQRMQDKVHA